MKLAILIPYYKNSGECEIAFKKLMKTLAKQIGGNIKLVISEDSQFIEEVYKRNPIITKIDSNYYYNYGINPNSLMMRFERSEIGLKRDDK